MKQILDFGILYESREGHSIQSSLLYANSSVSLSIHSNEASMYPYEGQNSEMNYDTSTVSKKCPRKNVLINFLSDVRFLDGIQHFFIIDLNHDFYKCSLLQKAFLFDIFKNWCITEWKQIEWHTVFRLKIIAIVFINHNHGERELHCRQFTKSPRNNPCFWGVWPFRKYFPKFWSDLYNSKSFWNFCKLLVIENILGPRNIFYGRE